MLIPRNSLMQNTCDFAFVWVKCEFPKWKISLYISPKNKFNFCVQLHACSPHWEKSNDVKIISIHNVKWIQGFKVCGWTNFYTSKLWMKFVHLDEKWKWKRGKFGWMFNGWTPYIHIMDEKPFTWMKVGKLKLKKHSRFILVSNLTNRFDKTKINEK